MRNCISAHKTRKMESRLKCHDHATQYYDQVTKKSDTTFNRDQIDKLVKMYNKVE